MRMMLRRLAVFGLAAAGAALFPVSAPAQDHDVWKPLEFLMGKWTGSGSGTPGGALAGGCEFAFDLDRSILVRRNRTETGAGAKHEDLMVIHPLPEGAGFRARYFDNEGHVIDYTVKVPEGRPSGMQNPRTAIFESDSSSPGPRFRLVHALKSDSVLATEFQIAPPGGEFRTYLRGDARKQ
jgi:hypothetical protein